MLRQTVEDYYCAKFQVIPIRGFRFIVHTHTHIVSKWSPFPRRRTTSSAPYYKTLNATNDKVGCMGATWS